jgi:uncharacterized protein YfeS
LESQIKCVIFQCSVKIATAQPMIRLLLLSGILVVTAMVPGRSQTGSQRFQFSLETAHPAAKELMKEEFYWSPIDESGPFGSDAGSDAAYGFQKWRKEFPTTAPILYLRELIESWNFPPFDWSELDTAKIKLYMSAAAHPDESLLAQEIAVLKQENERSSTPGGGKKLTDEQLRQIAIDTQKNMGAAYLNEIDGAIIGTAFAQFVIEGRIDSTIKNFVTKTIEREMLPIIARQFGRPDQAKEHYEKMKKLLQVVGQMPVQ